uniref:DUF427 domain-containing protein n=1 Tax=Roseihalotalea indica TaxID=2867963 RepID=A0AA49GSZ2_9BACT|nr:DUF427 domain-containing protein [Tunicatimonas sp. TK19036]
MKVIFNDQIIAESDQTEVVEGNHYFPPSAVRQEYFKSSNTHTTCPWKGEASYYSLEANGETANDAAWYYPNPKEAAQQIKDYVAFYPNKVTIEE